MLPPLLFARRYFGVQSGLEAPEVKRVKLNRTAMLAAILLAIAALPAPAAAGAAAAANVTWTGASASDTWSTAANWSAGVAPNGSVGVLALPPSSANCASWACSFSVDDIPNLTVGTLQIDSSNNYLVVPMSSGDAIQLLGGLNFATTATPASGRLLTKLVVPMSLGAPQSWSLSGVPGTSTQLALGSVTGELEPLTLQLGGGVTLQAPELDTGQLTISGAGTVAIGDQMAQPLDGVPTFPPPLISAQGVSLANGASLTFASAGAVSGPITIAPGSYSTLEIGHGVVPDGTVAVDGNVTMRTDSTLQLWIDRADAGAQPQPSADASQLTVFGNLDLNSASLALSQGFTDTQVDCARLAGGQVYTLIAATSLTGTFAGIANGQVVPLGACNPLGGGASYAVILSYNTRARPRTVTATVVGPVQIRALVARTLVILTL